MKSDLAARVQTANSNDIFAGYRADARLELLRLRAIILRTASETEGVGPLDETLKWGQPSFVTAKTGSGSLVRIDAVKDSDDVAVYFHCQTDLVETFRKLYPQTFVFEGNRALRFRIGAALPESELRHCIALALTYHSRRKSAKRSANPRDAALQAM